MALHSLTGLGQVYDDRGRFFLRRPAAYVKDHFLDTELKDYVWRPFLDPLTIGLGDQQLITGYAALTSSSFSNYICAISSSPHLAALISLRKYFLRYKLIARVRITLIIAFALFLLAPMIAAIAKPTMGVRGSGQEIAEREQDHAQWLFFIVPMFLTVLGFSTALVCVLHRPRQSPLGSPGRRGSSSSSNQLPIIGRIAKSSSIARVSSNNPAILIIYDLFLNPLIVFMVKSQKFAKPEDETEWYGLQDGGENTWGLGQTLSVIMLLLPAMSATQIYLEGRHDIRGHSEL
ncbi:hypothetical protein BCR34DRAFT_628981 [Clohesyomyces aquaticus]|uniref:Uncharacterized protein n=1 Tax=Clohesyomyces aquaticus TaxID=1231657 RepID=A0A1Y1YCE2_9PLEO|nr:hypothetical protein BCR34DRAFT_628981 [Clohesyomyces aquaticus]